MNTGYAKQMCNSAIAHWHQLYTDKHTVTVEGWCGKTSKELDKLYDALEMNSSCFIDCNTGLKEFVNLFY